MNETVLGKTVKVWMIYEKPWWRQLGLAAGLVADQDEFAQSVYEQSPADGSKGILLIFILGDRVD